MRMTLVVTDGTLGKYIDTGYYHLNKKENIMSTTVCS